MIAVMLSREVGVMDKDIASYLQRRNPSQCGVQRNAGPVD